MKKQQQLTFQNKSILDQSQSLLAIIDTESTSIVDTESYQQKYCIKKKIKCVSFQFQTGLIAYVQFDASSKVVIWDCKYQCMVESIDFIMPIDRIVYMRNILVVINDMRIIVRDFVLQQNIVYIPVIYGVKCFVSNYFQMLKIGYFPQENEFWSLAIWSDKKNIFKDIMFIQGSYDYKGELMILRGEEYCDIYKQDLLLHRIKYKKETFLGWVFDGVMLEKIFHIFFLHRDSINIFDIIKLKYNEDAIQLDKNITNEYLTNEIDKLKQQTASMVNNNQNHEKQQEFFEMNFSCSNFSIETKQWNQNPICSAFFFESVNSACIKVNGKNKLHIIQRGQHHIISFSNNF